MIRPKKSQKSSQPNWLDPKRTPFNSVFSWKEASKTGIPRRTFQRFLREGIIQQVRRGYYVHEKTEIPANELDYVVACKHFGPSAVIGGMTALFHYGLTENVPRRVWVLVPSERRSGPRLFRCIRTKVPSNVGVVENRHFRITTIERTIVDAFKFSTKTGLGNAVKAARTAISERKTTAEKIARQAREMGLIKVIEKNWEAISS